MNEKYDEKLWGQIELLHQKSKRQQTSFNYVMEMLRSLQEAFQDFSKIIQNILNKYHQIIEYHSISMYDSADKFVKSFESLAKEFKEGYNDIKFGIECLLGKKEFSWSEFGMKKLNFLLETAASIALKIITGGLSQFSKSNSLKTVFKQVGKKILRREGENKIE